MLGDGLLSVVKGLKEYKYMCETQQMRDICPIAT